MKRGLKVSERKHAYLGARCMKKKLTRTGQPNNKRDPNPKKKEVKSFKTIVANLIKLYKMFSNLIN